MIRIFNAENIDEKIWNRILERGKLSTLSVLDKVTNIINSVRAKGDNAIIEFTEKFDQVKLTKEELVISKEEIDAAYDMLDEKVINAIIKAKENIETFHKAQLRELWFKETSPGVFVGQIYLPLNKVGIYIPGGKAVYPSTVLMTVIPAKVSGVREVVMCTPPRNDKTIHPAVLVAANETKVDKIYRIGGAQAIAAMAYGTETVKKVDKIIGPGNIYVTAAKMVVSTSVSIDIPAGPSEVVIIADESANPALIAADLIAQAEHDTNAFCMLITTSNKLANEVVNQLNIQIKEAVRKDIIENALANNGLIVICKSIDEAVDISNEVAPEHLEILTHDPFSLLMKVKNAGAVFLGENTPVAIGDYMAGSNHVLPTGGYAKLYSALSVQDFVKISDIVYCSREGLDELKDLITTLANIEGFDAHGKSVKKRFNI
ncbi:MAG: histidinol dehydrogenase [Candidatus Odinarchaeia archaeon]